MARPRVEPEKIREVITLLEAEGKTASVTAIRQRLGSGSYSTIGAVLSAWRREQAAAVLPAVAAIPERVTHLVQNLWAEAWKAATNVHEPEREKFQRGLPVADDTVGEFGRGSESHGFSSAGDRILPKLWMISAGLGRLGKIEKG